MRSIRLLLGGVCGAMLALLLVLATPWLSSSVQAKPVLLADDTPTSLPPSPTNTLPPATATPETPTSTNTSVAATSTSVAATNTSVAATSTNTNAPNVTATSRPPTQNPPENAPEPQLEISKSAEPRAGSPGDFITFVLEVRNTGDGSATDVVISDDVPPFLEIYNVQPSRGIASNQGQRVEVRLDRLGAGETVQVRIQTRIRPGTAMGSAANSAVVQSEGDGGTRDDDQVTIEVLVGSTSTPTVGVGTPLPGAPLPGAPLPGTPLPSGGALTPVPANLATPPAALPNTAGEARTVPLFVGLLLGLIALAAGVSLRRAR